MFNVTLTDPGIKLIEVIREVRIITGLGLRESKELVENAPALLKTGITQKQADQIKKLLAKAGAKVAIERMPTVDEMDEALTKVINNAMFGG
jgi:large subunit ribosomal protein L7/L12